MSLIVGITPVRNDPHPHRIYFSLFGVCHERMSVVEPRIDNSILMVALLCDQLRCEMVLMATT